MYRGRTEMIALSRKCTHVRILPAEMIADCEWEIPVRRAVRRDDSAPPV